MTIGTTWSVIRGLLRDEFSFAQIKDVVGAAGVPIEQLAHLVQQFSGGATKGQLMDGIDGLLGTLSPERKDRFVKYCIAEILARKSALVGSIDDLLNRVGWGISDDAPYPLALQIDIETTDAPQNVRESMRKALSRYSDGDFSGAITAICGAVDKLTEHIYQRKNLGDHATAAYQERVSRSFITYCENYKTLLQAEGVSVGEVDLVWNNLKGAMNQAAYVLGAYRRAFSDVHGNSSAPRNFVQSAMDSAVFIIRNLVKCAP